MAYFWFLRVSKSKTMTTKTMDKYRDHGICHWSALPKKKKNLEYATAVGVYRRRFCFYRPYERTRVSKNLEKL